MINKITKDDLEKHAAWLRGETEGARIVTVIDADLSGADLRNANLRNANLSGADLSDANLSGADLRNANIRNANLRNANLRNANIRNANLRNANLSGADLSGADLSDANLSGADLSGAENIPDYVSATTLIVPDGDLIVYKSLMYDAIAALKIPKEARRSNATGRKCRAEYAEVLAIESKGGDALKEGCSRFDQSFIYRVGETVYPNLWCEDRWQTCAGGIHFYLTRYEAEN
jgi:hypothetical protein